MKFIFTLYYNLGNRTHFFTACRLRGRGRGRGREGEGEREREREREGERERERGREGERERERERERGRQRDRDTQRETETERQKEGGREREREREIVQGQTSLETQLLNIMISVFTVCVQGLTSLETQLILPEYFLMHLCQYLQEANGSLNLWPFANCSVEANHIIDLCLCNASLV